MQTIPSECVVRHLIVTPSEIHFLRFVLEAYEGIAGVTTLQPKLGLVKLWIAPGCEEEVQYILEAEKERLQCRAVALDRDPNGSPPPSD